MKVLWQCIQVITTTIIVGFLIFGISFVYQTLIGGSFTEQFISAFAGALFGFLFTGASIILARIYDKDIKAFNQLVSLNIIINKWSDDLAVNQYLLPTFIQTLKDKKVYSNDLHVPSMKNYNYDNLQNADIINQLFDLEVTLDRLIKDLNHLNRSYNQIKDSFFKGIISPAVYAANCSTHISILKNLQGLHESTQKDITISLVMIRLAMNQKNVFVHFSQWISKVEYNFSDSNIAAEKKLLESERAANRKPAK